MNRNKRIKRRKRNTYTLFNLEESIKKYQAEVLLRKIYEYSKVLFDRDKGIRGVLNTDYEIIRDGKRIKGYFTVLAWELLDLAYYTIKYSNDYEGKGHITHDELIELLDIVRKYNENLIKKQNNPLILLLYTMTGEQFRYQRLFTLDYITRENYILFECSKKSDGEINREKEFKKLMGFSWREIITILAVEFQRNDGLLHKKIHIDGTDFNVEKIIDKYTATYEDVRQSKLVRQHFYIQPFVKTQNNNYLQISPFLSAFIMEHCTYWLFRDKYLEKGDKSFPSIFGVLFEQYLKELLEETVPDNYKRIKEDKKNKKADWRVQLGNYTFLIEQKSGFLNLDVKQQMSNIDNLKNFFDRNIISAINQLDNTEKIDENSKCIKIILLYDDYLKAEVLDEIFKMEDCLVRNDHYYWLMDISEFEMLFYTYKNNRDLFFDIIKEKIKMEVEESDKGREIEQLLSRKGINTNDYLKIEKFDEYRLEKIGSTVIDENSGGKK